MLRAFSSGYGHFIATPSRLCRSAVFKYRPTFSLVQAATLCAQDVGHSHRRSANDRPMRSTNCSDAFAKLLKCANASEQFVDETHTPHVSLPTFPMGAAHSSAPSATGEHTVSDSASVVCSINLSNAQMLDHGQQSVHVLRLALRALHWAAEARSDRPRPRSADTAETKRTRHAVF